MSEIERIESEADDWDTRKLGADPEHVRKSTPEQKKAVQECLGLKDKGGW